METKETTVTLLRAFDPEKMADPKQAPEAEIMLFRFDNKQLAITRADLSLLLAKPGEVEVTGVFTIFND